MKALEIFKKLLPFMRIYPWTMPTVVGLGVTSSLLEGLGISLLIPFLQTLESQEFIATEGNIFLRFFNHLLSGFAADVRPFVIAAIIFAAIISKALLAYLYTLQINWLNGRIAYRLRRDVFDQLMTLGQQFWDKSQGGDLLNILLQQTINVSLALNHLIWFLISACMIVTFVALLLLISWPITLSASLAIGLISLLVRRMTRRVEFLGTQRLTANKQIRQAAIETFTGIRTIRAFGRESQAQRQFDRGSRQLRDSKFRLEMLTALIDPVFEGAVVMLLVGLMLGTIWTQISLPVLMTVIFMLYRLQPLVKQLDTNRTELLSYLSSIDKLKNFLSREHKPYVLSGSVPYTQLQEAIELRSVSFSYTSQETPALDNISLRLRRGETTALVGPSGAGKSTLINLICRFYDVTEGVIEADGKPLKTLKLADWRARIALVSQENHIFNTSLADNIAYGKLGATMAEIIAAAKQANAHRFICELPEGYNTSVGDRGIRLSGGQIQRIAIARAILRDPDILILDEATNALDSLSEDLIQEALYRLTRNRTVIVIAHRLSTIEHADQIVVLKDGEVQECGTQAQLLKKQGLFSQMYHIQHKPNDYVQA